MQIINPSYFQPDHLPQPVRSRFAPSPTGYLHPGHLFHILCVYGITRSLKGKVLLRLEDHDQTHCKPEYLEAIIYDLQKMGLHSGSYQEFAASHPTHIQSNCGAIYQMALQKLQENGHQVYACDCSRKNIVSRTGQTTGEIRYDGHCRQRNIPFSPSNGVRVQIPDQRITFHDHYAGPQTQHPANETGDLLLIDRNGNPTYHFAVVVDDLRMQVNLIIRGMDLIGSTGRQLLLAEMLQGAPPPFHYFHHPLITDESGRKLSKRDFDADIHSLLVSGKDASELLGEVASRAGLIDTARPYGVEEFVESLRM